MPVYEFEELVFHEPAAVPSYVKWEPMEGDLYQPEERRAKQLNYWGYTAGNYFAVKASYSSTPDAALEWKELLRELHANGMECVMEMYFDEKMNQNVILDALRYWVSEFHVDGFHLLGRSVPVTAIAQDMLLSRTKIFYDRFEPFLFEQKKRYPHLYLYNDDYYYPIRKILNQQGGQLAEFANQQRRQHEMLGFVNFVAGNNGFTLADLFSYGQKHNEANGEDNSDGNDWNYSTNCGVEGKTTRRAVVTVRERKIRNAFAIIMAAQGVPLFLAGDEFGNSQEGNNNAYCQDNRIGWLNWKQQNKFAWLGEYVAKLVQFRQQHPIIARETPMARADVEHRGFRDLSYHGDKAWMSDFPVDRQAVGMMYCGRYVTKEDGTQDDFVYVGYNFGYNTCSLAMPKLPEKKKWYLVMDTAAGREAFLQEETCMEDDTCVVVESQAVVYLVGK
jgi:glycogen operon protein